MRPRQAQAVERAGAAADFIQDDRLRARGVVQDIGGLAHLDHERGLAARQIVAGADAGEDAVDQIDARLAAGINEPVCASKREQRDLADVSALARHVRAR